jgi:excisionase family DNA binding protein
MQNPSQPLPKELAGRTTITVSEAAALLGIGRTAAYEAARHGELPTRRLGSSPAC